MITVRHLRKRFPGNSAASLEDISLEVGSGLFFSLFGPSGCGKSTLLRCIAGLEMPDEGEIVIDGVTVFSARGRTFVPPNRRRIGMVFQSYAVWPHMTVLENVAFPLEAQGKPNPRESARAAIDMVGLSALESRHAGRLSGGQQQRVAFARAIVANPALLLLDEPLSNLDAGLRDLMRGELQALQRGLGVTTLYVTHDQGEALAMSDRIVVMREGRLVESGTPEELYHRPRSSFTARLIGGANVIPGDAEAASHGLTRIMTPLGPLLSRDGLAGPVHTFIRPERVRPLTDTASSAMNELHCRVRARRFAGDSVELDLVPAAGAGEVILRCRATLPLHAEPESEIRVGIDPEDVRALPVD